MMVENKWKHVKHNSLVELTTVNGNKSGILFYLPAKEVDGLNCGYLLKVPWMQEAWEMICSLSPCSLMKSWLIEVRLCYQQCESLHSQKLTDPERQFCCWCRSENSVHTAVTSKNFSAVWTVQNEAWGLELDNTQSKKG